MYCLVVVGMDAELDNSSVDNVTRTEDRIVSKWRDVSANEKHQLREQIDELVRPFGLQTRLVVLERANSVALLFLCLTLSALMSLRHQWCSGQLRNILQSLFTFLAAANRTVRIKRLTWLRTDYERSLKFFSSSEQG